MGDKMVEYRVINPDGTVVENGTVSQATLNDLIKAKFHMGRRQHLVGRYIVKVKLKSGWADESYFEVR